jgi:hypothetical protein
MVNVVVAPYTVASGALPEGVLSGNPDDAKLEVMLAALWDLKALKEAANFVLRRSEEFALGLPTGAKRTERLRDVSRLLGQWSGEFDQLLAQTKKCMQSFTEECRRTAAQYESNPRIVQAALLPAKYRNACYHSIEVTQSGDSARDGQFKLFPTGRGDTEMGGGPVVVNATLQIIQDGPSTLRARVAVTSAGGQGRSLDVRRQKRGRDLHTASAGCLAGQSPRRMPARESSSPKPRAWLGPNVRNSEGTFRSGRPFVDSIPRSPKQFAAAD